MEKYVKYSSKALAQNKINSINQSCIGVKWTDNITINYSNILEHIINDEKFYLVQILDGYEEFFTSSELADLNTLTLDENGY
jgi:hypothetical protein